MADSSLSATVRPGEAAVDLEVSAYAVSIGVTGIIRADAAGTRPVRLPSASIFSTAGGAKLTDWEPALGGRVEYRLQAPNLTTSSAWVGPVGPSGPVFSLPFTPGVRCFPDAVTRLDSARDSGARFHPVIGREDPLVVTGRLGAGRGTLQVLAETRDGLVGLEEVLAFGDPVHYRQSEHFGLDMYFIAERVAVSADPEEGTWVMNLDYARINYPEGVLQENPGWSFETLARSPLDNFTSVAMAYPSFAALAAGRTL